MIFLLPHALGRKPEPLLPRGVPRSQALRPGGEEARTEARGADPAQPLSPVPVDVAGHRGRDRERGGSGAGPDLARPLSRLPELAARRVHRTLSRLIPRYEHRSGNTRVPWPIGRAIS